MEMRQDMYEKARTKPSFKENRKEVQYRKDRLCISHLNGTVDGFCGLTI